MSEYGEPWTMRRFVIPDEYRDATQEKFAVYQPNPKDPSDWVADIFVQKGHDDVAARIVACVNFCAGIPTEELEKFEQTRNLMKLPYASLLFCAELLKQSGYTVEPPPTVAFEKVVHPSLAEVEAKYNLPPGSLKVNP